MCIKAIISTMTPSPILSEVMSLIVEVVMKLGNEAQVCQQALASTPVGIPLFCQFPGRPSLNIDSQTQAAASVEFGKVILPYTFDVEYHTRYTSF